MTPAKLLVLGGVLSACSMIICLRGMYLRSIMMAALRDAIRQNADGHPDLGLYTLQQAQPARYGMMACARWGLGLAVAGLLMIFGSVVWIHWGGPP